MARRKKDINIHLVAQEAEVSVATVSRVVNHRTDVSEKVRQRVQSVIEKLNFSPDKGSERRYNIGVIVSVDQPIVGEYCSQLFNGIVRYSGENNADATIIFHFADGNSKSLLQTIRERRCNAVVLITPEKLLDQIEEIDKAEIPTILINSNRSGNKIGFVNNESYNGAMSAVNFLLQLGHRSIGFLCGPMVNSDNHHQRLNAYKDALEAAGVPVIQSMIIPHQPTTVTQEAGYYQTTKLLDNNDNVTAIFCANDEMALGSINACWKRGLSIPEDISIIGFDDIPQAQYTHPPLTTVRQPLNELGYRAIKYLDYYLKDKIKELPTEILGTELVIRQSTQAPAKK